MENNSESPVTSPALATSSPTIRTSPPPLSGLEPTLVLPASERTAFLSGEVKSAKCSLESHDHVFPLQPADLSADKILLVAPRVQFEGHLVPALGGIPLIAKIAQGGMGAVYLGYKPLLGIEVAVKVLPLHLVAQQPSLVEQFVREARIAARIHSPHLVTVSDVNEENELFYLVMEFVNGKSAGKYVKEHSAAGQHVDEAIALEICTAATDGMAAAHADGVIHRDIKPDNILIPKANKGDALLFGAAKLSDLGLAHGGGSENSIFGSLVIGTPGYMAPEQWEAASMAGKAADVFSMGATLYAILVGQPPFTGSTTQLIRATIEKPHIPIRQLRSEISASTAALLERCLAKAPERRYADGCALLDALKTCLKNLRPAVPVQPSPLAASITDELPAHEWRSLKIHFQDRFHSAKALGGVLINREELGSVHHVHEGTWLLLDVGRDLDEVVHLVPWTGENELYFKTDGPALFAAPADEGPWILTGMDTRGNEGEQALKWAGTGGQVTSVIVKDLMDPRAVHVVEQARPVSIRIEGKAPFVALGRMKDLRYLSLINNESLADLVALKDLGMLQGLNIDGARNLKTFYGVQRLHDLSILRVANCPQLMTVTGLESLPHLEHLAITMCMKAQVQGALSELRQLCSLQLTGLLGLNDLSGFEGMDRLTQLNLNSCYGLKDITALASLNSLTSLNLRRCDIVSDLRPILWLKNLRSLGMPPKTTDADLAQMREAAVLDNLRILDLGGCTEIASLQALRGLSNLARLTLSGCYLIGVTSVTEFSKTVPGCIVIQ